MSPAPRKPDPMAEAVRRRLLRAARAREDGSRFSWEHVALIGSLAWQIVIPTLIGVALGRWIDRLSGHQVLFSAAGIILGVSLGFWMAWRKVNGR